MALPPSGSVARRAAQDALANVGVHEDGPPYENSGTYVLTYLHAVGLGAGNPWCAAFLEYRLIAAAHELGVSLPPDFPRGTAAAAAADWADWGQAHGLFFRPGEAEVQPGDLVCYDIASEGGIHHCGIVIEPADNGFVSVEGNTHPDGEVTRDGYCVARRERTYGSLGARGGFVRVPYGDAAGRGGG